MDRELGNAPELRPRYVLRGSSFTWKQISGVRGASLACGQLVKLKMRALLGAAWQSAFALPGVAPCPRSYEGQIVEVSYFVVPSTLCSKYIS